MGYLHYSWFKSIKPLFETLRNKPNKLGFSLKRLDYHQLNVPLELWQIAFSFFWPSPLGIHMLTYSFISCKTYNIYILIHELELPSVKSSKTMPLSKSFDLMR